MPSYITEAELRTLGGDGRLFNNASQESLDTAMEAASAEADTYLSASYTVPLTTVSPALKLHVARAALYHFLSTNGFNPNGPDDVIERNYDRALNFYKALQKSQQALPNEVTEPDRDDIVHVVSTTARRERW